MTADIKGWLGLATGELGATSLGHMYIHIALSPDMLSRKPAVVLAIEENS